jgi:hypothetical protein
VLGRVEADHRRRGTVAAPQQQLAGLLAQRAQRELRRCRRERLMVEEDGLDVLVARDA